jgi:isopenicillin-N N-acyltransferase-like protein
MGVAAWDEWDHVWAWYIPADRGLQEVGVVRDATPLVVTAGTPFERGQQLGTAVPERVRRTVDAYFGLFHYHAGLDVDAALHAAERFVPVIEKFSPELLEEMRGIAAAVDLEPLKIVAINARTELLHGTARPECTAIAVAPPSSVDRHVRLAQNWDWYAWLAGTAVLWAIHRPGGVSVLTYAEAGLVGKIGLNSRGLGLAVNLLLSDADNPGPAVPMHVVLRHVLDTSSNATEAARLVTETPRCTSANHLMADRAGTILDVEATPSGCAVIESDSGVLTHANHCADPALIAGDRGARSWPETLERGRRATDLSARAQLSVEDIRTLLTSHVDGAAGSICVHADPSLPAAEQEETVAAMVIDLTDGTFDLIDGPPCSAEPVRYVLSQVFDREGVPAD